MTTKATQDVLAERQRQIDVEGWTPEHDDDEHINGELEEAATCYMLHDDGGLCMPKNNQGVPSMWPWDAECWKPKSRRENLVRAAALRLAEKQRIERILKEADEMFGIAIDFIERLDRQ